MDICHEVKEGMGVEIELHFLFSSECTQMHLLQSVIRFFLSCFHLTPGLIMIACASHLLFSNIFNPIFS